MGMGWGMKDSLLKNFTEQFLNNQDMGGNVPTVVAMKRDGGNSVLILNLINTENVINGMYYNKPAKQSTGEAESTAFPQGMADAVVVTVLSSLCITAISIMKIIGDLLLFCTVAHLCTCSGLGEDMILFSFTRFSAPNSGDSLHQKQILLPRALDKDAFTRDLADVERTKHHQKIDCSNYKNLPPVKERVCYAVYAPIHVSDGKTYSNDCYFCYEVKKTNALQVEEVVYVSSSSYLSKACITTSNKLVLLEKVLAPHCLLPSPTVSPLPDHILRVSITNPLLGQSVTVTATEVSEVVLTAVK
eukprot:bmy_07361T0